jgi:hypothetical protein
MAADRLSLVFGAGEAGGVVPGCGGGGHGCGVGERKSGRLTVIACL